MCGGYLLRFLMLRLWGAVISGAMEKENSGLLV